MVNDLDESTFGLDNEHVAEVQMSHENPTVLLGAQRAKASAFMSLVLLQKHVREEGKRLEREHW